MPDEKTIGHCLCGAVEYSVNAAPISAGFCYCVDCQKRTGADSFAFLFCEKDTVEIKGELEWFEMKGGSGQQIARGGCKVCGSPVTGKLEVAPEYVTVAAMLLDDPKLFTPQIAIWTDEAPKWAVIPESLMTFSTNPM